MITADNIRLRIEEDLSAKGFFIVDLQVKPSHKISVFVDTLKGITLEECTQVNRLIEQKMNRENENFELEVSSPGLNNPLKLPFQYEKNVGRSLRVIKTDGLTTEGKIMAADTEKVLLETLMKKSSKGKMKETQVKMLELHYTDIKTARIIIR
jgi:ribosome maturation factor RimP